MRSGRHVADHQTRQRSPPRSTPGGHRGRRQGGTVVTAGERTGWRDQELSRRHRRWGFYCPGVDLDFVLVEYHLAAPVAIVEYKHHRAQRVDLNHPTYQALCALADREPAIPFMIARYWPETWAFAVRPVNACAVTIFGGETNLSEREFVTALHDLRSLTVQQLVLRHLNTERPPATRSA